MLVFRLFRVGKNNQPSFKIVVTDKRNSSKGGRFVEQIGFYNPVTKEKVLNKERVQYWLKQGVQPSPTLHNLFIKDGILEGKKIPVHKKSRPQKGEARPTELGGKKPAAKPEDKLTEVKLTEVQPLSSGEKPQESPKPEEPKKEKPVKTEGKMKEAKPLSSEAPKTE